MKAILTHAYFLNDDPKEKEIMRPYAPLGLLYISSWLTRHKIENEVIDTTFSDYQHFCNDLADRKPDIIGIYTNLMTKLNVLNMLRYIRTALPDTKIVLGGPEVRHHAGNFLAHGADLIVFGEGEETMKELCLFYKEKGILPSDLAGTVVMEQDKVRTNPERLLIKDLSELSLPARDKIDLKKYMSAWKQKHGYSMLSVSTMRGCPYTCKWCSRAVYGGTYRRRKPAQVADELLLLKEQYNPDRIWFVDDVFTISHKWLNEFAAELKQKNVFIPFEIITRADRLNEEVIRTLKEISCFRIWIGAESGSQKIIDAMDRRVAATEVREMIQLTKKYGMEAGTFIMLGYPGEKKKDIRETIRHLQISRPDQFTITVAYPIKGTRLYEEIESAITTENEWSQTTDRQTEFERGHSRKFYDNGVRWVYNAVYAGTEKNFMKRQKFKIKAIAAQLAMFFS